MAELAAFQMVGQRGAIAAMAKSPLVFHGNGTLGTLVGITANVPWVSGEVGKSGTYDDEGMTKGKFAVGAHPNGSWFAMVVPARGNLCDGSIGIAPLSKLARESSLAATPVTDIANFSDMRSDF